MVDESSAAKKENEAKGVLATAEVSGTGGESNEDVLISEALENKEPVEIPVTPTAASTAPAPVPKELWHTVQKGETLSGISRKYYNTVSCWKSILEANKNLISDPKKLRVGMRIVIPPRSAVTSTQTHHAAVMVQLSAAAPSSDAKTYVAMKGDTLYSIAKKFYNDGSAWKKLLKANADKLKDPKDLREGMSLVVP